MEKFQIHVQFIQDESMVETHDETTLVSALQRLTFGPAARMGIIEEVQVVDRDDCTNYLAQKVNGQLKILYPPHLVRD